MSSNKKLLQSSSGYINQSSGGLSGDGLFKVQLYVGNATARNITTGIDLANEGGLVWGKARSGAYNHWLYDTARGAEKPLVANTDGAEQSTSGAGLTAFNSNGFSLSASNWWNENQSNIAEVAWTFRKATKFFDIVTYTGDGSTSGRQIAHSLGSVPGMIIFKRTDSASQWIVYHRSIGETKFLYLNANDSAQNSLYYFNNTAPTSTHFTVRNNGNVNANGGTYVAYLFAHNDGDGGFGDGTQDFIKCGTYTGGAVPSNSIYKIDLGFEPQWVLIKRTDASGDWTLWDTTRGMPSKEGARASYHYSYTYYNASEELIANSNAEVSGFGGIQYGAIHPYARGFGSSSNNTRYNQHAVPSIPQVAGEYVYVAIRKTPMTAPTTSSEVFDVKTYTGSSNFTSLSGLTTDVVDMTTNFIRSGYGSGTLLSSRLTGHTSLKPWTTNQAGDTTDTVQFGFNNKITITGGNTGSGGSTYVQHFWKRAPKFFDVITYLGTGSTISLDHNLQATPELIIVKVITGGTNSGWETYWGQSGSLFLNTNEASGSTSSNIFSNVTSTQFSINGGADATNDSGASYVALLFASLSGISKVGTFTHPTNVGGTGQSQIDCGFSSGSKYILLKRTDSSGDWYVFDSVRGYGSGYDPYYKYNTDDAEVTNSNVLASYSSGFQANANIPSGNYIFYAISA